jgi:hypothetical protein
MIENIADVFVFSDQICEYICLNFEALLSLITGKNDEREKINSKNHDEVAETCI